MVDWLVSRNFNAPISKLTAASRCFPYDSTAFLLHFFLVGLCVIQTGAVLSQGGPRDAAVHFDTYRPVSPHPSLKPPLVRPIRTALDKHTVRCSQLTPVVHWDKHAALRHCKQQAWNYFRHRLNFGVFSLHHADRPCWGQCEQGPLPGP